jgi:hypothetical protein
VDAGAVATAINTALGYTTNVLTYLKKTIDALFGALFRQLAGIFNTLLAWLKHLRDTWFGKILSKLWTRAVAIYRAIHNLADKINKTLQQIKRIQDYYYDRIFKPIFDLIQRLRRVLAIFRLLHLRWAQRLDQDLANAETRLAKIFLDVRRELNRMADYINMILDPTGLYNAGVWVSTAARSITELASLLWGAQYRAPGAKDLAAQATAAKQFNWTQARHLAATTAKLGVPEDWQAHYSSIRGALAGMGYPT